jgi:DNA polymerase-3 subunit epsilon
MELQRRLARAQFHECDPVPCGWTSAAGSTTCPRYRAHSAVVDAIACAELFLAQVGALEARGGRPLVLGDVLDRHA